VQKIFLGKKKHTLKLKNNIMSWMTKHTKNLLSDIPIDNKASALNHNSFPVHEHPHPAKGKSYTKEIKDLPRKANMTKKFSRIPAKTISVIKPKGIVKL
jgi:hypothetical protein